MDRDNELGHRSRSRVRVRVRVSRDGNAVGRSDLDTRSTAVCFLVASVFFSNLIFFSVQLLQQPQQDFNRHRASLCLSANAVFLIPDRTCIRVHDVRSIQFDEPFYTRSKTDESQLNHTERKLREKRENKHVYRPSDRRAERALAVCVGALLTNHDRIKVRKRSGARE